VAVAVAKSWLSPGGPALNGPATKSADLTAGIKPAKVLADTTAMSSSMSFEGRESTSPPREAYQALLERAMGTARLDQ